MTLHYLLLLLSFAIVAVNCWYVPELTPVTFGKGDEVMVYTNTINSEKTQLPFAYAMLNFACPGSQSMSLNLGEILRGDRIHDSPIKVR